MCTMMVLIDGFPEDVPEARAFAQAHDATRAHILNIREIDSSTP